MFKSKSKLKGKFNSSNVDVIDKNILINAIDSLIKGNAIYIGEGEFGSKEVSDKWNELVDKLKIERTENTIMVNNLLTEITKMDSLRDIIKSTHIQTDELHSLVNNSKELNDSIEDLSNISQEVANHSRDISINTETGVNKIEKSMEFIINYFDEMKNINKEMKDVKSKTESINQIIDIVKGIANQTNLLALNAAIEAARAGEHGKGFSIVASEIRKLAEHTKTSLEEVKTDIIDLNKAIDLSVNQIEVSYSELNTGRSIINEALSKMQEISDSIGEIDITINQVASNVEEQSAITENLKDGVEQISKEADFIDDKSQSLGEYVYNTSKHVDSLRIKLLENRNFLDDKTMIEVYKTDHLLWKWKVYNMFLGNEEVDPETVADYKGCRLGKWYYGIECSKFDNIKEFKDMEKPHRELHEVAKEAIIAFKAKDIVKADKYLEKMDYHSTEVFNYLDRIKNLI